MNFPSYTLSVNEKSNNQFNSSFQVHILVDLDLSICFPMTKKMEKKRKSNNIMNSKLPLPPDNIIFSQIVCKAWKTCFPSFKLESNPFDCSKFL